jgi:hypothetical protein
MFSVSTCFGHYLPILRRQYTNAELVTIVCSCRCGLVSGYGKTIAESSEVMSTVREGYFVFCCGSGVFRVWGLKLVFGVLCDLSVEKRCLRTLVITPCWLVILSMFVGDLAAPKFEAAVSSHTSVENCQSTRCYDFEFIHWHCRMLTQARCTVLEVWKRHT